MYWDPINSNSIRNRFEIVCDIIKGRIGVAVVSDTKIDSRFPNA